MLVNDMTMTESDMLLRRAPDPPQAIGLLLIDDFPLMAYAAVVEPFRAANLLAGRELYRWRHVTPGGAPARASNGATLLADHRIGEDVALDRLFVIMGGDPVSFGDPAVFAWLRQLARRGVSLGGVSGGAYALARAGLLEGYRCTIHWEHLPAFVEEFDRLAVSRSVYVIDRGRMTCAGGVAALDMIVELVEHDHGTALGAAVGDWFIRTHVRTGADAQRPTLRERHGVANDKVLTALGRMEQRIEDPVSREDLAAETGVSVRQLERLFVGHVGASVGRAYLRIRLAQARRLLRQTAMSVVQIAMATGFAGASHFSRAYRAHFSMAPTRDRKAHHPRPRSAGDAIVPRDAAIGAGAVDAPSRRGH
jgi:transcriptional regulator GlxA family with amidase domain